VKPAGLRRRQRFFRALGAIFSAALIPILFLQAGDFLRRENPVAGQGAGGPGLKLILDRAAEYCDKLNRSVLNFVCRERIEEWFRLESRPGTFPRGIRVVFVGNRETYKFIYDYQLIRDREGFIRETRTLLKENGKDVRFPDAPLKTHCFWHAKVVMGPLGLLSRERQAEHDYRIVREDKIRGEEVLVVEAVPKPGVRMPHLLGTIWLRKMDAGILKIEWNPTSIDNYQGVEETAKRLGLTPSLLVTSEYAFEKNGIRFPSRYTLREIYRRGKSGARYQRSETDVIYDQYKFFTVETNVEFGK